MAAPTAPRWMWRAPTGRPARPPPASIGSRRSGALLSKLAFPVPGPTMPCFAERHLYVTTLREGRSPEALQQHPTMGGLFRADAPVLGAPVAVFADA